MAAGDTAVLRREDGYPEFGRRTVLTAADSRLRRRSYNDSSLVKGGRGWAVWVQAELPRAAVVVAWLERAWTTLACCLTRDTVGA